jgi:hypothetical protein
MRHWILRLPPRLPQEPSQEERQSHVRAEEILGRANKKIFSANVIIVSLCIYLLVFRFILGLENNHIVAKEFYTKNTTQQMLKNCVPQGR